MSKKTILITGAAGFIGSHLMDRLSDSGMMVVGMDKKLDTSTSSYNVLEHYVAGHKPDIIVHLGANCSSQISLRDPLVDFTDNVVGTFNVCEVSRRHGNIPIIFNSTMKVYPGEDGIVPPYGQSKLIGEQHLRLFNRLYGVPYIINRPSSVYGPRQDGTEDGGWFTWFIRASLSGDIITLFGDGSQSRDVLYVDDCVDILEDQVRRFKLYENQEFDFGGGEANEVSLNGLLDELDYHNIRYSPKLPGDVQRFVSDNLLIHKLTGWTPKTSWRDGLVKTMDYFNA